MSERRQCDFARDSADTPRCTTTATWRAEETIGFDSEELYWCDEHAAPDWGDVRMEDQQSSLGA